jgi:hypothetical protein
VEGDVSTLVDVRVPATEFGLERTMAQTGGTFELAPVVMSPDPVGRSMLLARGDPGPTEPLLAGDPSVREAGRIATDGDDGALYAIRWGREPRAVASAIEAAGGTILSAIGYDDAWRLRLLFDDRRSLSTAFDRLDTDGRTVDVDRIESPRVAADACRYGLSAPQYETLVDGFHRGLFSVPRETDLSTMAAGMDVSHQALSERLRRAHGTLVENALVKPTRPVVDAGGQRPAPPGRAPSD